MKSQHENLCQVFGAVTDSFKLIMAEKLQMNRKRSKWKQNSFLLTQLSFPQKREVQTMLLSRHIYKILYFNKKLLKIDFPTIKLV